jgi:hypothetical protein
MKFTHKQPCACGGIFRFTAYGTGRWSSAACPECGTAGGLTDPLSVSVTTERLLYRSKAELEDGDYTLSIVIAVMAVESFLARLFFKVKGMDCFATRFSWHTEAQEKAWEVEYPRKGGFTGPRLCFQGNNWSAFRRVCCQECSRKQNRGRIPWCSQSFRKTILPERTFSSSQSNRALGLCEHKPG